VIARPCSVKPQPPVPWRFSITTCRAKFVAEAR
jgi:hypothetical protein